MPFSDCFHYELHGEKTTPPVLFLHGFLGSTADWHTTLKIFDHHFHCLAIDLPGHGKTKISENDKSFSMPLTAGEIMHILNQLDVKKCSLVGYSMGGRLALYLAVHFPHRFDYLVLESASPGLESEADRKARRKRDEKSALELEHISFKDFLQKWYDQPLFQSIKNHPGFQKLFERRLQNNPTGLAKSLRFMGTGVQPSLWSPLHNLNTPTLILAGGMDEKFVDISQRMGRKIKNSKVKIIQDCGHNIHFENPQIFSKEIQTFIKMEKQNEFD